MGLEGHIVVSIGRSLLCCTLLYFAVLPIPAHYVPRLFLVKVCSDAALVASLQEQKQQQQQGGDTSMSLCGRLCNILLT